MGISGYMFPLKGNFPDTFFIKSGSSRGWGTWEESCDMFNPNSEELYSQLSDEKLRREFNYDNSNDYYGLLKMQVDGLTDSWAIRWYASVFLNNGLTLYYKKSLVDNFGHDTSGIHSKDTDYYQGGLFSFDQNFTLTDRIEPLVGANEKLGLFFKEARQASFKSKIKRLLNRLVNIFLRY